jgi:predicted GNAT superfamily acetyltransferase
VSTVTASIKISRLNQLADFERCVQLQVDVWGYSDSDLIPKRVFLLADRIGGQVLGAFDGEVLAGFAMSLPAYRHGQPYLHSHMLAVGEAYRNAGLGRRLKMAQREDALARGILRMEWTFDPLEIKNSYLNIARLGAIVRRYEPDFYGPSTSVLQGGLPTDRLVAEWWLRSPRVRQALGELGNAAGPADEVLERITVPHGVYDWKRDAGKRKLAEALQTQNRNALQSAFGRGLAVVGYERNAEGDGAFLLGRLSRLEAQDMLDNPGTK